MKSADELKARLGGHMRESMGAARDPKPTPAGVSPFHGETAKYQGAARVKDALAIEVDRLSPDPDQPRKEFEPEALADLAASMKARGQLQPIRVRWDEAGSRWIIIAGERRYRAALLAGMSSLLCVEARGPLTPDDLLEDQLIENIIREDLKPIEQAHAFKTLLDRRQWSYRQLGEALHIAPASIARSLALLELPAPVQERVTSGELAPSVAYEVAKLADPGEQAEVAELAIAGGLNREDVVRAVRERSARPSKGRGAKAKPRKTSVTLRTTNGYKLTAECRKGIDDDALEAALAEALASVRARRSAEAA